jgi:hypothetical protein
VQRSKSKSGAAQRHATTIERATLLAMGQPSFAASARAANVREGHSGDVISSQSSTQVKQPASWQWGIVPRDIAFAGDC